MRSGQELAITKDWQDHGVSIPGGGDWLQTLPNQSILLNSHVDLNHLIKSNSTTQDVYSKIKDQRTEQAPKNRHVHSVSESIWYSTTI